MAGCGVCDGGWVTTERDGVEAVAPCLMCRTETHQRWSSGQYAEPVPVDRSVDRSRVAELIAATRKDLA